MTERENRLNKIRVLDEESFPSYMAEENLNFRKEHIYQSDFSSFDGLSIRYYKTDKRDKGCIVILHGYCGFFGKFHEMCEIFYRQGYQVFFLEHRGHGYSGREIDDKDIIHVNDYDDYVEDTKIFMDSIVVPESGGKSIHLFGHSMGGAISALFLEKYPGYFKSVIFSSPMFSPRTGNIPKLVTYLLRAKIRLFGEEKKPFSVGKRFDGVMDFENSCTMSRARFKYLFDQRIEDEHYHTSMSTYGWAASSLRAVSQLMKNAYKIKLPSLLFIAGNDTLVDPKGQLLFAKKTGNTEVVRFENAKHELFNATKEIQEKYYLKIFEFLDKQAITSQAQ